MRLVRVFNHQKLFEGASDYQAILDNFPYDQIIQSDDGRYPSKEHVRNVFNKELVWAKETLQRPDRVIWWLKYVKFIAYHAYVHRVPVHPDPGKVTPVPKFIQKMYSENPNRVQSDPSNFSFNMLGSPKRNLEHFMGIDDPRIQNYHFLHQTFGEILNQFEKWEDEYKQQEGRKLAPDASHTVIMKLGDLVWLNLNKAACADEGHAGRHCGNSPRSGSNDRILSLRRVIKGGKQEVCLTFVLEEDGFLGERKGFANSRPDPKYHRAIVELLKQPFIKGFKQGRWMTSNDFKVGDLSPELGNELFEARPEYFSFEDVKRIIGEDDPRLFDYGLKIARNLHQDHVAYLFDKFPDRKYELVHAMGEQGNPHIDVLDHWNSPKLIEHRKDAKLVRAMIYNGLTGEHLYFKYLEPYDIGVNDPIIPKLIKKARAVYVDEDGQYTFENIFHALPREMVAEFTIKNGALGNPFADYKDRFEPDEIDLLLKNNIIPLIDYIEYYGKDSPKVLEKVKDHYSEANQYDDYISIRTGHLNFRINSNSIQKSLSSVASMNNSPIIPKWFLSKLLTPPVFSGLQKAIAEYRSKSAYGRSHRPITRTEMIDELMKPDFRHARYEIFGMIIENAWAGVIKDERLDIAERWNTWLLNASSKKQVVLDISKIKYMNEEYKQHVDDQLKAFGLERKFPLTLSWDTLKKPHRAESVIVNNNQLVDFFLFCHLTGYGAGGWDHFLKYDGPIFKVSQKELESVIDYEKIRAELLEMIGRVMKMFEK